MPKSMIQRSEHTRTKSLPLRNGRKRRCSAGRLGWVQQAIPMRVVRLDVEVADLGGAHEAEAQIRGFRRRCLSSRRAGR